MAYISTEEVKQKRKALKKALPTLKLSVTCRHHSELCVAVMGGDFNFEGYENINHYIIADYDYNENIKTILKTITDICTNDQKEVVYDGDYGSVPNYYFSLSIGKWDKKYTRINK